MQGKNILIAPSILSADFGNLSSEARRLEQAQVDAIHIDIMDGHFVPNLTLGPKAVAAINRSTELFLDVHIMIYNPFDYIERLVESGADRITFHFEATESIEETLLFIRKCGIQTGLAFRPETSADFALKYLKYTDLILMMTVSPGFGGQAFMPEILDKIRFIRKHGPDSLLIQVDGGVDNQTAKQCVDAGADVLVSGTYVFKGDPTLEEAIEKLRAAGGKQ